MQMYDNIVAIFIHQGFSKLLFSRPEWFTRLLMNWFLKTSRVSLQCFVSLPLSDGAVCLAQ